MQIQFTSKRVTQKRILHAGKVLNSFLMYMYIFAFRLVCSFVSFCVFTNFRIILYSSCIYISPSQCLPYPFIIYTIYVYCTSQFTRRNLSSGLACTSSSSLASLLAVTSSRARNPFFVNKETAQRITQCAVQYKMMMAIIDAEEPHYTVWIWGSFTCIASPCCQQLQPPTLSIAPFKGESFINHQHTGQCMQFWWPSHVACSFFVVMAWKAMIVTFSMCTAAYLENFVNVKRVISFRNFKCPARRYIVYTVHLHIKLKHTWSSINPLYAPLYCGVDPRE